MDKTKAAYIAAGADPVLIGKMFTMPAAPAPAPEPAPEAKAEKKPVKKTARKAR
jgi:hypothetical protein